MVDHLIEANFYKLFPGGVDEFPTPVNCDNYIDAWLLKSAFSSLTEIETYLLFYKAAIEAPLGDDILGDDGSLAIDIPAARYPSGKITMARDSSLIDSNIRSGVNIFGVTGSLVISGGGMAISLPEVASIADAWVYLDAPSMTINTTVPAVAAPAVSIS